MSHPTAFAASFNKRFTKDTDGNGVVTITSRGSSRDSVKASLEAIKYSKQGFKGAEAAAVKNAIAPHLSVAGAAPPKVASVGVPSLSDEDITRAVTKMFESRMQKTASDHDHLLDEAQSLSTVVQFKYAFRKPLSGEEITAAKKKAADAGKPYTEDRTPETPLDVSFDEAYWKKAFGNKIDFSKDGQYALAGYVESVYSTAPVEFNWTLDGIQGRTVERVHSSNGTAATLTILPGMNTTDEKLLFRLKDINTKHLFKHGNLDMQAELDALVPLANTPLLLVDPSRKLGKILKRNEASIIKNEDGTSGELTMVPVIDMYAVHEDVLVDVLDALNSQVLSELKTTAFPKIVGSLTRADRSPSQAAALDFADFDDAPGLTKAGRSAAHTASHQVTINVRFHAIDPAKLEKQDE